MNTSLGRAMGPSWTNGYYAECHYSNAFHENLNPESLNLGCLLNGVLPPTLQRNYSYFELGAGFGLTSNILAASNPEAQFIANDFMPAHVSSARQLARESGARNVRFVESSFAELANGEVPLPEFDYITMHGVWTWISAENRARIVRFIDRHLKPGGLVSVSYNALPGWASSLPIQRVMQFMASGVPGSATAKVEAARQCLAAAAGGAFFEGNEHARRRLLQIAGRDNPRDVAYLAHEYLHQHWEPMYHADVVSELAGAKLDFVGSTNLLARWLELEPAQRALVQSIDDPAWRETMTDFMLNTGFRSDIFVRGKRTMSAMRRNELIRRFSVCLIVPVGHAQSLWSDCPDCLQAYLRTLVTALADGPRPLGDWLTDQSSLEDQPELTALAMLHSRKCVSFYCADNNSGDGSVARRFNAAIAAAGSDDDAPEAFASPVTGSGVPARPGDRVLYGRLSQSRSGGQTHDESVLVSLWNQLGLR